MQTKKITNILTIFVFGLCLMFFGMIVSNNSKIVFGEGDVVSITATYDGVIIKNGQVDFSKISITATYDDESIAPLDAVEDVNYYYNNELRELNNYYFGAVGQYELVVKLKTNEEIFASLFVTVANQYTISFNANGGGGEMEDALFVATGTYTLPLNEFEAPNGKMFGGWAIGSLDGVIRYEGDQISVLGNTVLFAIWKNIPTQTAYFVEFDANGGSGEMATQENVMSEYILPQCTYKAPAGKVFAYYKVEGVDEFFTVGSTIMIEGNTKVYVFWKDDCIEVSFDYDEPNKQIAGKILEAQNNGKVLRINVGDCRVEFNSEAVNSFSETSNASISFVVTEENLPQNIKGAQKIVSISLNGTSFSEGEAKVFVPLTTEHSKKQVAKVFYIDEQGYAVPLKAVEENGNVVFTTNHFSEFIVAYQQKDAMALSTGIIVLITIIALIVMGLSGFCIYWFGIKKNTFYDLKYVFKRR